MLQKVRNRLTSRIFAGSLILLMAIHLPAFSQIKTYSTKMITGNAPEIDGITSDSVWNLVEWGSGFLQREPYDGKEPSQETSFKILYDDNNLYVAIRAWDTEPDKIERRLTRRDEFEGDWVAIGIDSYADKLTAFSFAVNAAGVKADLIVTNEDHMDLTWNPVWYVKVSTDSKGWSAEMRIPFTQLRFAKEQTHTWGLQIMRQLFRKQEFSVWQHIPVESSRWVSLFGELEGISGIKPKKEVEFIPYAMGNIETYQKEEGNPFATGNDNGYSLGVDGKIAVTNDLTLNFTVNPDFGQVEADPSEVNLTAFESFFEEKRPFFIEGSNIFNFPVTNDGPLGMDNLFYSRRIGRRPHGRPELNENEYSDQPEFSSILGAFKLSGKTRNGLSVGIMESIVKEEFATIDNAGERRKEVVEPMTNFFNTRLQKDFNKGNRILGGMFTATNRRIDDPSLEFLTKSAYTGGLDFTNFWKEKNYFFSATAIVSHISGSKESMLIQQTSSRRYYQRPDASHLTLDSNRTSLTGNGGTLEGGKIGGGHWRYGGFVTWRTPGLELNDMGYLREADIIQQIAWVGYRIWEPFGIFRSLNFNAAQWMGWDFGGNRLYLGADLNAHMQFKNYWSFGAGINRSGQDVSRSDLRGGPALKLPGSTNIWSFIETDERKRLIFQIRGFYGAGDLSYSKNYRVGFEIRFRPLDALSISVEPSYSNNRWDIQYVVTEEYNNENRYIVSTINTESMSADIRINFGITPDISIQFWGQPFLYSGLYSDFKKITESQADDYYDRFHTYTSDELSYDVKDKVYSVDENQDGSIDYSFKNPNFDVFEFRSNLVARWEYIPGSTIYLVWSQGRDEYRENGNFNLGKGMNNLFDIAPHNIFLIKISYRISL